MEGNLTFKEHLPLVRLLPCLAISIISLLATNPSLHEPSTFEYDFDSSDENSNELFNEDSDQEGPDELPPDEAEPDKFNSQKFDIDAVLSLADAMFRSKTSSSEALSLRCSRANDLGGPDALTHERTVAVLDALAYVSVNESSPTVAIDLTVKPLKLVVQRTTRFPPQRYSDTSSASVSHFRTNPAGSFAHA